jgi:hypothetical protein
MRLLLLLVLSLAPVVSLAVPGPWEKVGDSDGILVHRRKVEGSFLHEFRGRGVVRAPLARVVAVIRDAERRTEWMERCVGSHSIEQVPDNQVLYNRTGAPWPVTDRDVVLRGRLVLVPAAGAVRLEFESTTHPEKPPVGDAIRIHFLRGHWQLIPVEGGKATHVEYQVHADPAGRLPDWVSNIASKSLPLKTLQGLRGQVKKASYPEYERSLALRPEFQAVLAAGLPPPAP